MAYINKLININSSINNINDEISATFDNVNNAIKLNIVAGSSGGDGQGYLYDGAGLIPITSTNVGGNNGIDSNIINTSVSTSDTNLASAFDNINNAIKANVITGSVSDGKGYAYSGDETTQITATGNSLDVNITNTPTVIGTLNTSDTFMTDATLSTLSGKINNDNINTDAIQVEVKNTGVPITGTFYQVTQPVSGTLTASNSFALDSTLSTLSGKIKSDTVHANAIQVEVKNTGIPITGTFYQATQPVSGTVDASNLFSLDATLSGLSNKINNDTIFTNAIYVVDPNISDSYNANAIKINVVADGTTQNKNGYCYNGSETTPITSTNVSTKNGLDMNVINASVDVSNSNIPANLTVNSNNLQIVEKNLNNAYDNVNDAIKASVICNIDLYDNILLYDHTGVNAITATNISGQNSLDVCLNAIPTHNSNLKDGSGVNITSTTLATGHIGIDTTTSLYVNNGSTALTATSNALNTNITNASLTVQNASIANTYDAVNDAIKIGLFVNDGKGYLYDGSGVNAITNTNVATTPATLKGIDTATSLYTSNADNTRSALTATNTALDVNVQNTIANTIVGRLSNGTNYISTQTHSTDGTLTAQSVRDTDSSFYFNTVYNKLSTTTSILTPSINGLNTYSIPTNNITIIFGGVNETNESVVPADAEDGSILTGIQPGTVALLKPTNTAYRIGSNNLKTFFHVSTGSFSITVRYCDSSNNLQTITVTATTTPTILVSNIINVISCELAGSNAAFSTTDFVKIYHTAAFPNITMTYTNNFISWITIPNNYRGIIKSMDMSFTSAETLRLYKYGPTSDFTMIREWRNLSGFVFYSATAEQIQFFNAGETFFFGTANGTALTKKITGWIELEYII